MIIVRARMSDSLARLSEWDPHLRLQAFLAEKRSRASAAPLRISLCSARPQRGLGLRAASAARQGPRLWEALQLAASCRLFLPAARLSAAASWQRKALGHGAGARAGSRAKAGALAAPGQKGQVCLGPVVQPAQLFLAARQRRTRGKQKIKRLKSSKQ